MSEINQNDSTSAPQQESQDGDLTLKDVLETLIQFWHELWRKKWWIIAVGLLFAAYFGYQATKVTPVFNAKLTYLFNDSSGGGSLSGLLGSFGLGGDDKANLNQVMELSKSHVI